MQQKVGHQQLLKAQQNVSEVLLLLLSQRQAKVDILMEVMKAMNPLEDNQTRISGFLEELATDVGPMWICMAIGYALLAALLPQCLLFPSSSSFD